MYVASAARVLRPLYRPPCSTWSCVFPIPKWTSKFSAIEALQLKTLPDECCYIAREDLLQLTSLTNLSSLQLSSELLDDASLGALPHLTSLTRLDIARCSAVSDQGLQHLAGMRALQALSLENCYLLTDDGALSALAGLTALQELNLTGCHKVGDGIGAVVERMGSLERLFISRCGISEVGLEGLQHLQSLHLLEMNFCVNVALGRLDHLSRLTTLRALSLRIMKVTDQSLRRVLKEMEHMQDLNLSQCFFLGDACIPAINGLKHLTALDLSWTSVSDSGLKGLGGLCSLRELCLENSSVTYHGLAAMTMLTSLTSLWFKDCEVSADEVAKLRASFPASVTLHT